MKRTHRSRQPAPPIVFHPPVDPFRPVSTTALPYAQRDHRVPAIIRLVEQPASR